VREKGRSKVLTKSRLRVRHDGRRVLRVRSLTRGRHSLVVLYRDSDAPRVRQRVRVRVTR